MGKKKQLRKEKEKAAQVPMARERERVLPRQGEQPNWTPRKLAAIVSLLTFAIYLFALGNDFVNWDDTVYVYKNLRIRSLDWGFFKWAFTDLSAGFWHPLTWISLGIDYALWGLNPMGYHLTAVLLHVANTFLVVLLMARILQGAKGRAGGPATGNPTEGRYILIAAGVTGILFGLHPLHVESVAWASERKDILCAFFFLLSALAYVEYALALGNGDERPFYLHRSYLLALGLFVCALAAKTMAVTLPLVFLILDWYPFNRMRSWREMIGLVLEKAPFIICSVLIAVISVGAQTKIGALSSNTVIPLAVRMLIAFKALGMYLWKMIVPLHLLPLYSYPLDVSWTSPAYLFWPLLVSAITAATVHAARERPAFLSAWAYYVITLLPVLGLVQIGPFSMADRFTYLPSLGPFLLVGLGAASLLTRDGIQPYRFPAAAVAGVGLGVLALLTVKQIAVWNNSVDFWNYLIDSEGCRIGLAYTTRGGAFLDKGEVERAIKDFDVAIGLPSTSETVVAEAYSNRGMAFLGKGELERALADFNNAIKRDPSLSQAYVNRGMVLQKMGRLDSALDDYAAALQLKPVADIACKIYSNRGAVFFAKKEFDKAVHDFDAAIAINPGSVEGYRNRGVTLEDMGQFERAIEDYTHVLSIKPRMAEVYLDRGNLYRKTGESGLARQDFQKACDLGNKDGCAKSLGPER